MMTSESLVVDGVWKRFGSHAALSDVSLAVKHREVLCVIGPSGSGKTTLLRILAGLEKQDSGTVRLNGTAVLVLQHSYLWPHKTVLENVSLPLVLVKKLPKREAEFKAMDALNQLGLSSRTLAFPESLSGGEMQRVAIARALVMGPDILLLDEITSGLDPLLVNEVVQSIKKLVQEKKTLVVVTHHLEFAKEIADRIVFLHKGRIVEEGFAYKLFSNPSQSETRQFVQSVKGFA